MKQLQAKLYGLAIRAASARSFMNAEKQVGATAIEYALIAAVMAVVVLSAFTLLGEEIEALFSTILDQPTE